MKLNRDYLDLLGLLNDGNCDYVIVGAHALAAHGVPRFTGDLDILVRPTCENAGRVLTAVRQFGFSSSDLAAEDFLRPNSVVQLGRFPRRIDLLTSITGVSFDEAFADCVVVEIDGLPVRVLGRNSLIRNKKATGRAKDLADLESLERGTGASPRE